MGFSARKIGDILGVSAQKVNSLLKEHGYMEGITGHYRPTEKGKPFASIRLDSNDERGYALQSREWIEWTKPMVDIVRELLQRKK